jgi:hypothetical protein
VPGLDAVPGLLIAPLRLVLRVTEIAAHETRGVLRLASELVEAASPSGAQPSAAEAPMPGPPSNGSASSRARAAEPPPAPPRPEPVSEEPVLAAEFAEPGAEEGAGAEVYVDEPWEGYERMTADEVCSELAGATPEALAAVRLYEQLHRDRRSVLDFVERRLHEAST